MFIGLKYDYGDPSRGYSYEYENFFGTLSRMENVEAIMFPFDEIIREHGRGDMNERLLESVRENKPDICFFFLFTDEIRSETIQAITNRNTTITVNWFADDHWRFGSFSQYWAPLFHWVITTDPASVEKYHRIGIRNVIQSQWGFNHYRYIHTDIPYTHEVTFIGQSHSNRKSVIQRLQQSGIPVQCWGKGWANGRLDQDEMVRLFSSSKINLNFAQSSFGIHLKPLLKVFLTRRADGSVVVNTPRTMASQVSTLFRRPQPQIKGRNFEIPGFGGFLLTEYAEGIEECFVPDKEIAVFRSVDELREKIRYFLDHEDEREAVRQAGHDRALKYHTFEKRFEDIFQTMLRK